jgi:hypothetical protein
LQEESSGVQSHPANKLSNSNPPLLHLENKIIEGTSTPTIVTGQKRKKEVIHISDSEEEKGVKLKT